MEMQMDDTHSKARYVQLRLLREAGTARRIALTWSRDAS
jgi:hypothetical protein